VHAGAELNNRNIAIIAIHLHLGYFQKKPHNRIVFFVPDVVLLILELFVPIFLIIRDKRLKVLYALNRNRSLIDTRGSGAQRSQERGEGRGARGEN